MMAQVRDTQTLSIGRRQVAYRVVNSSAAKRLRVRVGPGFIEVLRPCERDDAEVRSFLREHSEWIAQQISRLDAVKHIRRPESTEHTGVLLRGEETVVRLERGSAASRCNLIEANEGGLVIRCGGRATTTPAASLQTWLRKQARREIAIELQRILPRTRHRPTGVYVMDQRTKWGGCSARGILTFNWRLVLAPPFVLRYIVVHEAVHLSIPDHSPAFWLTVQSLCPDCERARQWLAANGRRLVEPFAALSGLE